MLDSFSFLFIGFIGTFTSSSLSISSAFIDPWDEYADSAVSLQTFIESSPSDLTQDINLSDIFSLSFSATNFSISSSSVDVLLDSFSFLSIGFISPTSLPSCVISSSVQSWSSEIGGKKLSSVSDSTFSGSSSSGIGSGSGSWIFKSAIITFFWSENFINSIFVKVSFPSGESSLKSWIVRILFSSVIK